MNIKQLKYFIAIVENNFNLSQTAKSLYISQPTLSIMINNFEEKEGLALFHKSSNQILGLTDTGEKYYNDAVKVTQSYDEMNQSLHQPNENIEGTINIGVPPVFLSTLFSTIAKELFHENQNIEFNFIERGANSLASKLIIGEIDLATLLFPENLPQKSIESIILKESEFSLFMSSNHPLVDKPEIYWEDLHKIDMVILDDSFRTNLLVNQQFKLNNIHPNILLEAPAWDFLTNMVNNTDNLLTILPHPISDAFKFDHVVVRKIIHPIPWTATLSRLKKDSYSKIETQVYNYLRKKFSV